MSNAKLGFNIAALLCGVLSAAFWWWAAWIPAPKDQEKYFGVLDSEGATPAMRKIAKRNRWAATFTGAAALFGALGNLIP